MNLKKENNYSIKFLELLEYGLNFNPTERPTVCELYDKLETIYEQFDRPLKVQNIENVSDNN